jgi:hypothetical protein
MSGVGFEPTIPVFERAKTIHALDRTAAVIGNCALQDLAGRMNEEERLRRMGKTRKKL